MAIEVERGTVLMSGFLWLWVGGGLIAPALEFSLDVWFWGLAGLGLLILTALLYYAWPGGAYLGFSLTLLCAGALLATYLTL